jgi:ankyrin repeat protein
MKDEKNVFGDNILTLCAFNNDYDSVKYLIGKPVNILEKKCFDINIQDIMGNSLFHICAANNFFVLLDYLLKLPNSNPKLLSKVSTDFEKQTCLHRACYYGSIESVLIIIKRGKGCIWKSDINGDLPIHLAARKFNILEIRVILQTVQSRQEQENFLLFNNCVEESTVDILKKYCSIEIWIP